MYRGSSTNVNIGQSPRTDGGPVQVPAALMDQRSSRMQFSILNLLEFISWIAFILVIATTFHWFLALIIGAGSAIVFGIAKSFEREEPNEISGHHKFSFVVLGLGVVAQWIFYYDAVFLHSLVTVSCAVVAVVLLIGLRRYRGLAICLLLSPIGYGGIHASIDYWRGTAVLPGHARDWATRDTNIDRVTRLRREHIDGDGFFHLAHGKEFTHDVIYEYVIVGLTRTFGFMRGTYSGPYPTREQALEVVSGSKGMSVITESSEDVTPIGAPVLPDFASRALSELKRRKTTVLLARIAYVDPHYYILHIKTEYLWGSRLLKGESVLLVSLSNDVMFAEYKDGLWF